MTVVVEKHWLDTARVNHPNHSLPFSMDGTQDFVAFGKSPSPPPARTQNAQAGPSRPSTTASSTTSKHQAGSSKSSPGATPSGPKGKKRARGKEDDGPGPRNLKEEKKARDRSAPWCDQVDWSSCRDPAEMYVCRPTEMVPELELMR
jgi:hypothetical protein